MISLLKTLPKPQHEVEDVVKSRSSSRLVSIPEVASYPPYGQRSGWIPRRQEDYNGGGAFPEIHIPQFPLNMGTGKKVATTCGTIAKQVDAEGKVKYDALARVGQRSDKIIYSKATDLLPKYACMDEEFALRPDESVLKESMEKTNSELQKIVSQKISKAMPVKTAAKQNDPVYMRYTPAQQGSAFNSGAKQSIVKIFDVQVDPLEPPMFKTNKKIPRAEPSPPVPVLHSPAKKITVKERQEWKIPPAISNWKNAKGYTIPLDKRLAADGRGLQQIHANEKFAKMTEALAMCERKAREEIEMRNNLEMKSHLKEQQLKEEKLRLLSKELREQRSGIAKTNDKEAESRDELRKDLSKERQRERNIARAAPEKRNRLQRERERDVSEKIALGLPNPGGHKDMYDQRLFNQTMGLDSGFAGGADDRYDIYDEPWGGHKNITNTLYKAPKATDDNCGMRDPVQFEKDDDPFGLHKFLDEAKRGLKRKDNEEASRKEPSKKSRRS